MKKYLLTFILAVLALAFAAGEVAQTRGDTPITEFMPPEGAAWFSIEPAGPSFEASLSYCIGDPLYHFAYYLNDHTFAELNYYTETGLDIINLKGSYLLDLGLFVALEYESVNSCLLYTSPSPRDRS